MGKSYLVGTLLLILMKLGLTHDFTIEPDIVEILGLTHHSTIEPVKLEIFDDKFRLSIPNDHDIKWVTFNVNINKEFGAFDSGHLTGLVEMPKDQRWTYEFQRTLANTDLVYVLLTWQNNTSKIIFHDNQGPFSVGAIRTGDPDYPDIVEILGLTHHSTIEPVKLEIFDDKFRLSIPNDHDIKWVTFNVNINKELGAFDSGHLTGLVVMPKDQRWTYEFQRTLANTDLVYVFLTWQNNTSKIIFHDNQGPFSVGAIRTGDPDYPIPTTTTTAAPKPDTPSPDNIGSKQCFASVTEVAGGDNKHCKGDLLFEDNFDLFDTQRWTNEVRLPLYTTDAEFVLYNGTAYVDNGELKIPATLYGDNIASGSIDLGNRCTGITKECSLTARTQWYLPPVISGRINCKKTFNFKYGRIEVKAKMPKGDWLVPLILLEPNINKYGEEDYKSGEMRIGFTRGNLDLKLNNIKIDGTRLYGGAVLSGDANSRHQFMANVTLDEVAGAGNEYFGNTFHVYSLIWKPNELLLSVDNYQYGNIKTDFKKSVGGSDWRLGGEDAPLDQMFYLTLGLSAGGHGDFPQGSENKPWLNTAPKAMFEFNSKRPEWHSSWQQPSLEVDYIRVYAV